MKNVFLNLLQHEGLYKKIKITEENIEQLIEFIGGECKISIYCPECRAERVFSAKSFIVHFDNGHNSGKDFVNNFQGRLKRERFIGVNDSVKNAKDWMLKNWSEFEFPITMMITLCCAMDSTHRLDYVIHAYEKHLIKIGQYPSIATLSFSELDEYKHVMDDSIRKEFGTALGLFANGVGIGAYTYLRRIFETILMKASKTAIDEGKIEKVAFNEAKVTDKIKMIKDELPETIVDNPVLYGIISKGIHELSEEECIEYFPVMKDSILLILNQWEKKREEIETKKRLNASISKIASKIK